MKAITTLDQIKNMTQAVYVRWSVSFAKDQKRGYSLICGGRSGREAGLSACRIDQTWDDWRIVRQLTEYRHFGGNCWIITGQKVGSGSDNEELIRDAELVGKVAESLTGLDWVEMYREAQIKANVESLEKATDAFGRAIIEKSLRRLQNADRRGVIAISNGR